MRVNVSNMHYIYKGVQKMMRISTLFAESQYSFAGCIPDDGIYIIGKYWD